FTSALAVDDGSAYPESASYEASATSSTLAAGTRVFTSAGEISVTPAPSFCACSALWRRCVALSAPARASKPTFWKPGSPPPPTITTSALRGTSTIPPSLLAQDQSRVCGGLVDGHARRPVRAELRRDAEPAHPVLPHRGRLVGRPQHVERQRANRRAKRRQRNAIERRASRLREQQPHLLAAAATLAGSHARARQPLDLVLVDRPVA